MDPQRDPFILEREKGLIRRQSPLARLAPHPDGLFAARKVLNFSHGLRPRKNLVIRRQSPLTRLAPHPDGLFATRKFQNPLFALRA